MSFFKSKTNSDKVNHNSEYLQIHYNCFFWLITSLATDLARFYPDRKHHIFVFEWIFSRNNFTRRISRIQINQFFNIDIARSNILLELGNILHWNSNILLENSNILIENGNILIENGMKTTFYCSKLAYFQKSIYCQQ